jgi:hypothetical protein
MLLYLNLSVPTMPKLELRDGHVVTPWARVTVLGTQTPGARSKNLTAV